MTDKSVIAYSSVWPFSETRHFSWDYVPTNTMAYDNVKEHFGQCLRLTFVVCHGIRQTQWELQSC